MIHPHKIKYNNIFSDKEGFGDLEIILEVAFQSDNGTMSSYLNRSAVTSESYDGRYKNTIRYKYDELFAPQFTIVKKDFSDFTREEVRKVLKYLTSTDRPALLEAYYRKEDKNSEDDENDGGSESDVNTVSTGEDDDDVKKIEYDIAWTCIGGFTNIELYKLGNSRVVGIVAQFEAITPYAMSKLYKITKTISGANDNQIVIDVNTDDHSPVYPRITVNHNGLVVQVDEKFDDLIAMSDYAENTAYQHESTYYTKIPRGTFTSSNEQPNYPDWETVQVYQEYSADDVLQDNTIYYYEDKGVYYWIEPYSMYVTDTPDSDTTSVIIVNQYTDPSSNTSAYTKMQIQNSALNEKIIIDGANKVISSSNHKRIFGNDFVNWTWLPLYAGQNVLTIIGNCDVTIEYREVIKMGEW